MKKRLSSLPLFWRYILGTALHAGLLAAFLITYRFAITPWAEQHHFNSIKSMREGSKAYQQVVSSITPGFRASLRGLNMADANYKINWQDSARSITFGNITITFDQNGAFNSIAAKNSPE